MNEIEKMDTKKLSIRNTRGEISPLTTKYHQLYTQEKEEKREEEIFHGSQKKENLSDIIIMRAMRRRHTISALLWYRDQESEDQKQRSKYVRDIP
jgi:hypothetical protein